VAFVDEAEGVLGRTPVDRLHDQGRRPVAVSGHQSEERAERLRVQRRVGAVAGRGAFGFWKDPGRLLGPDGLRRQAVPAGQVDRPEVSIVLRLPSHLDLNLVEKFQPTVQRYG
jgi:hypothetical protein